MQIKPLIGSPSPRDIPEVKQNQDTIECDKLLVKYYHAKRAYKIIRSYFLDHEEYTHLILHPDDLIVNNEHFNILKSDIERHDYQVLSGTCNVSTIGQEEESLAITLQPNFPHPQRDMRKYGFVTRIALRPEHDKNIWQVAWAGFPFMWIRRDILEKIELVDDSEYNLQDPDRGWAFDVMFCYNCKELGIPIYVDFNLKARMRHLKGNYRMGNREIQTGIKKPKVIFINGKEEQDITEYCNNKYLTEEDWKPYKYLNPSTKITKMI